MRPYHQRFHDLETAREHLARNDGWVLKLTPYKQVLAIDARSPDPARTRAYLEALQAEKVGGYHWDAEEFNRFYAALRARFGDALPAFRLEDRP